MTTQNGLIIIAAVATDVVVWWVVGVEPVRRWIFTGHWRRRNVT